MLKPVSLAELQKVVLNFVNTVFIASTTQVLIAVLVALTMLTAADVFTVATKSLWLDSYIYADFERESWPCLGATIAKLEKFLPLLIQISICVQNSVSFHSSHVNHEDQLLNFIVIAIILLS